MSNREVLIPEEIQMRLEVLHPMCGFGKSDDPEKESFMRQEFRRIVQTPFELNPEDVIVDEDDDFRLTILEPLRQSIAVHGQMVPITVTRNHKVRVGTRRLEACRQLGIPVKCVYADPLTAFAKERT